MPRISVEGTVAAGSWVMVLTSGCTKARFSFCHLELDASQKIVCPAFAKAESELFVDSGLLPVAL